MENNTTNYIDETISKKKIKLVIICTIICCIFIYTAIKQYMKDKESILLYIAIILFITLIILLCFSYYFGIYKKKKFISKRDKILQKGIHIIGTVISKNSICPSRNEFERKNRRYYYYVTVSFTNNNKEEVVVDSPWLTFHPNYISSDLVDVYLYNEDYYITNYRIDTEKMQKDISNYNKNQKETILLVLIMVPLFMILINLIILDKISPIIFGVIFMGSFLGIAIYSTIKRFKGED